MIPLSEGSFTAAAVESLFLFFVCTRVMVNGQYTLYKEEKTIFNSNVMVKWMICRERFSKSFFNSLETFRLGLGL